MKTSLQWILAGAVAFGVATLCRQEPTRGEEHAAATEVRLGPGESLQAALDSARPGDVITLEAGATFTGPFKLRHKQGEGWITIRSSAEERLPRTGGRVAPSQADHMPKLESASEAVIQTESEAHHYRFVGMEIRPKRGTFLFSLVSLGGNESSVDRLPHHIVFERCYFHGDPERGSRRGIALNSRETEVVDSYFADFKEVGADSQAIAGWNGAGPFRIENNYLEGAGENVIFGGSDPTIRNLVPADIVIRGNHFMKPLQWKEGEAVYEGTPWTVKNLFELKNARRVLVEGNLFEQNWAHAQSGFAILFTVRNQDGASPWSVVEDVTFVNNHVRHTGSGVNILGFDDNFPSGQTRRIIIRNNLWEDVGGSRWGGGGRLFQLLDGAAEVAIEHNTAFQTGNILTSDGRPNKGFVFRDNIVLHNGIAASGLAGLQVLNALFPGVEFRRNVIVGGGEFALPPDNFFPRSLDDVGFVDYRAGIYRLRDDSPYKNAASDGKDVGVDFVALKAAFQARPSLQPGQLISGTAAATLSSPKATPAPSPSAPEAPRVRVDMPVADTDAVTRHVRAGDDLQAALHAAQPGDVIVLDAGATFVGPFTLPYKPGDDWISIQSSAAQSELPPPGVRVSPSLSASMPKLESSSAPVLTTAPGAHHYRLVGIEIRPRHGTVLHDLVLLGADETAPELVPHHIVFERCYLHGDRDLGARRGIALNGAYIAVVDSYLADFKAVDADSEALSGWNAPGPIRLENNHLEAAGNNVRFGGTDPRIRNLIPSDIEILRNRLVKPLSWKPEESGYEGTAWAVKTLLALKNARRVRVEANVLENNWVQTDSVQDPTGFAVQLMVRNQGGTAPWSVVEDVSFAGNLVRHSASGIHILGRDDLAPSQTTRRIAIVNNLFEDIGGERWGGGVLLHALDGTADVVFAHNTALNTGSLIATGGKPHTGFVFRDNVARQNPYGIVGAGTARGPGSLDAYFPGGIFRGNVIVGASPGLLPPGNYGPRSLEDVGFVDLGSGDYRITAGSPYKGMATDGKDIGVDMNALAAARGALSGACALPALLREKAELVASGRGLLPAAAVSMALSSVKEPDKCNTLWTN